LIKRDAKDGAVAQRIDIIERAALDGAQTVKRIQGFALQQNDVEFEHVDVNQLVQDSTNLTRARWCDDAQSRGLAYDVDLQLNPTRPVLGVASELREVFVNFILNALDAMPKGGILRITTDVSGQDVRVSFADDGVGMTREVRERIFEPFFTTKSSSGMGLGLAVSYSIIERHRGRIEVSSAPREGATFTVTLPAARSLQPLLDGRENHEARIASVLVIDDDEWVCDALAGLLSSAGHTVERVAAGQEGLAKMEERSFDLVVTDLSMPGMDGWAVAAEIRRRWPHVKVVLATGFALTPEVLEPRRSLVDAVVVKPIRIDDITATLSRVLP
jgi:CheY-like chemotaxis protein